MSYWNQYLTKKLLFEDHPGLDPRRCLDCLQRKNPCHICRELCPEEVFSASPEDEMEPVWENCSGCGVCVSACPTHALTHSALQIEKLSALLSRRQDRITITCRDGLAADLRVEYPGALPWEYLCLLALQGTVILLTGDCSACPGDFCRTALEKSLAQARAFLGESLFRERILLAGDLTDPSALPAASYSRREAIRLAFRKTGRTAAFLLPSPEDLPADGTLWRQLLVHRIRQLRTAADGPADTDGQLRTAADESAGTDGQLRTAADGPAGTPAFSWLVPLFRDSCSACGICARLCPEHALLRAPGPEGSGRFYMAVIPWRCTGCGLCSAVCPEKAIGPAVRQILEDPEKPILHAVRAVPCSRCKEPVPGAVPDGGKVLCARCRAEKYYSGH